MYDKVCEAVYRTWQAGGTPGVLIIAPYALAELKASTPILNVFINMDGQTFLLTTFGKLKIYVDRHLPKESFHVLSEADAARLAQAKKQQVIEILGLSVN